MSRHNFTDWNYGYTLGPQGNNGDYTQYYNFYGHQGGYAPAGGRGKPPSQGKKEPEKPAEVKEPVAPTPAVIKAEPVPAKQEEFIGPVKPGEKEEGEIEERSLQAILHGRNPVMYCNDQSKMRNMHMEWEQVSEIGPPHDKTFEYQLKMGELVAKGIGKSKKDAKTKAAEDMVIKVDQLPKLFNKRPMGQGGGYGGFRGGFHGGPTGPPNYKKRRPESEEQIMKQNDVTPKISNPAQENPISKLFEFAKRRRWPEPLFDTVAENVLETRRTQQGFTLKKTEFTMRCTVRQQVGQGEDKIFQGTAMTKKQAKYNAAAAAWAELGGGITQASVDNLLSSQRKEAATAAAQPVAVVQPAAVQPVVAVQPVAANPAVAVTTAATSPVAYAEPATTGGNKKPYYQSGNQSGNKGYNRYRYNRY